MRVIMIVNYSDGCTYDYDESYPLIYDSPEQAYLDFEELAKHNSSFIFNGYTFYGFDYFNSRWEPVKELPRFLTVDEWFNNRE